MITSTEAPMCQGQQKTKKKLIIIIGYAEKLTYYLTKEN
jgi:hypothetical protein